MKYWLHSFVFDVNIGYTILMKDEKLATHMHLWLKFGYIIKNHEPISPYVTLLISPTRHWIQHIHKLTSPYVTTLVSSQVLM